MRKNYPPIVRQLGWAVLFATLLYALWYDALAQGRTYLSPDLLLVNRPSWSTLWQPLTAVITLPYQGLQITMLFDLALLNLFLSPICSFVVSFLSLRNFLIFLAQLIIVGTFSIFLTSLFSIAPPSSLFGSVALCVILFWTLLHKKGQHSFFTIIPVRPGWALSIPALLVLLPSLFSRNWAKLSASCAMCLWTYLWAISRWKLRSNVSWLQGVEDGTERLYLRITTFFYWHLLRHLQPCIERWRKMFHKSSERRP